MKFRLCLLTALFISSYSGGQTKKVDTAKAIQYHKQALNILTRNSGSISDVEVGRSAVKMLDQATYYNPKYIAAYRNKSSAYFLARNYHATLKTLDSLLLLSPNDLDAHLKKGHILKFYLNRRSDAQNAYQMALNIASNKRKSSKTRSVNLDLDIAFITFFSKGQKYALEEIMKLKSSYRGDPNSLKTILAFENLVRSGITQNRIPDIFRQYHTK